MRKNSWIFLDDGSEDIALQMSTSGVQLEKSDKATILKDVSVVSLGEAKGHGFAIDQIMLDQILTLGAKGEAEGTTKVHLNHPEFFPSAPRSTMYLGSLKNFKMGEGRVLADLHFSEAAKKSPQGNLVDYVLARVEEKEEKFGLSILFRPGKERKLDEPIDGIDLSYDVKRFGGADVVENPAANSNMYLSEEQDNIMKTLENNNNSLKETIKSLEAKIDEISTEKIDNKQTDSKNLDDEGIDMDRVKQIIALCKNLGLGLEKAQEYIDSDKALDEIMLSIKKEDIVKLEDSNGRNPQADIKLTGDAIDKMLPVMEDAILLQSGVLPRNEIKSDVEKSDLGAVGLHSLARKAFQLNGEVNTALGNTENLWTQLNTAGSAGTSTLMNVLSNVLNKSAAKGYEAQEATFQKWVGQGTLKDFKTQDLVSLTGFSDIDDLLPGQAPSMGAISDYKEQARLKSVGKGFSLDRRVFINDDLGEMTKIPMKMMMALKRKQNRDCYDLLTSVSFAGPTLLQNSLSVFNTTNGNVATSDGAVTEASLDTGIQYFDGITSQSAPDNAKSDFIYVRPKYILMSPKERNAFFKLSQSTFYNATDSNATDGSIVKGIYGPEGLYSLQPIVEKYLETIDATSVYPWYLIADAMMAETMRFNTLRGANGPYTISGALPMGAARGFMWILEDDYSFSFVDYRGIYRNKGQ